MRNARLTRRLMTLFDETFTRLRNNRESLVSVGLQGSGTLAALLFTSLLARHLNTAEFGNWVYWRNLVDTVVGFAVFSLPQYILFIGRKELRELTGLVISWWLGAIAILLLALFVSLVNTLVAFGLSSLFLAALVRPLVLLQSRIAFGGMLAASWMLAICALYLFSIHSGSQAVIAYGFGFLVPALYFIVSTCLRYPVWRAVGFDLCRRPGFFGYNIAVFFLNISQNFAMWYMVRNVLQSAGPEEAAMLGVAFTIIFSIALLPVTYFAPLIQQRWSEGRSVPRQHDYWKFIFLIAVLGIAAIPFLKLVITLIFGTRYLGAVETSAILLLATGILYFDRLQMLIEMSMGYADCMNYSTAARTLVIVVSPFLFEKYDSRIAGLALVAGYLTGTIVAAILIHRRQNRDQAVASVV